MTAPPVQPQAGSPPEAREPDPMVPQPEGAWAGRAGEVDRVVAASLREAATGMQGTRAWFQELARRLAAAHAPWVARIEVMSADPDEGWRWIGEYGQAVAREVVQPLHDALAKEKPGVVMAGAVERAVDAVRQYAAELPEFEDLPDATAIYRVQAADSVWKKTLKRAERARRWIRSVPRTVGNVFRRVLRRPLNPGVPEDRRVPLRQLVDFHGAHRVAGIVDAEHAVVQQEVGQAVARAINAVTVWTMRALEVERALDRADHHQPPAIQERLPRPAPAPDDTGGEDGGEEHADWRTDVTELVRELQDGLESAAAAAKQSDPTIDGQLERIVSEFHTDLEQAGTLLLSDKRRTVVDRGPPPRRRRAGEAWGAWHERAVNRLALNARMLTLHQSLQTTHQDMLRRLGGDTVEPAMTLFDTILGQLEDAAREHESICDPGREIDLVRLSEELRALEQRIVRKVRQDLRDVPGVVSAHQSLSEPGQPEWDRIVAMMATLPGELPLNQARPGADDAIDPSHRSFSLNLRGIATDALEPPFPQRLAGYVGPMRQRVVHVWDQAATIEEIIHFNFSATLDELSKVDDPDLEERPTRSEALEHARALPAEAMRRSQDTLRELTHSFGEPWYILADGVFKEFQSDWVDLHRRMDADRAVEERFLGYRARLNRLGEDAWAWIRKRVSTVGQYLAKWFSQVSRQARALIRRGQAAVGVAEVSDDESLAALDAIVDAPQLHAALPLVYRRLFAFEPISESALFEGRGRDVVRVRRHFDRWDGRHDAGVLVVSGPLGAGRTSFLNVVEDKVFAGCEVHRVSLRWRVADEATFATLVAEAMEIDGAPGLTELEAHLTAKTRRGRRVVCLVDNLEHLVLQGSGGTALVERVLSFMARTDLSVYWMTTVGREAWQFVSKTAGSATGFVTHFPLQPFTAESLEDVLMSRHTRSGIPLHYALPEQPGAILRQRLRRARTEEQQQDLLRREFFNGLFDAAGQNVNLALFYWLRAADFESRPDALTLRPVDGLSFRFFDAFDLGRTFTLKAFVLHNTLTPDRLGGILRMSSEESAFILESLLNQRIIERVDEEATGAVGVVSGAPYRIRRLLLHPVVKHLRNKHIVY